MRGYLNGLPLNTAILNGSGAEGILFADLRQDLDVIGALFSATVDVSAMLDAGLDDFAIGSDGSADISAQAIADMADMAITAICDSIIDTDAIVTLDHHTLTIFMREPIRRHAGGGDLARHLSGASLARHGGGATLTRH